ncbi:MAG: DUF4856 domain-containing protein [Fulvivirga sp.]|nr:DUF4856 domain-containing protein [Fulvivirga sp.]
MILKRLLNLMVLAAIFTLAACENDDDAVPAVEVPETYEFTRDGASTVSFQGQIDRLNMVAEMKTEVTKGDAGETVSSTTLLNMFANENDPFSSEALNNSTKQLENKTFIADVQWFKDLFASAEGASKLGTDAAPGQAGRIERGNTGKFVLVNGKGWEYTQFIEKGLMGAVFYHQIYNTYMTDDRVGDDVENDALVDGKNYTPMEHHWDEAFGYWGVPVDFPQGDPVLTAEEDRFWAKYTNGRDDLLGVNKTLMDAYKTGRAAIVAKQYDVKDVNREIIYATHELVAAATAVHYINDAMADFNANDQGNLFHHLSEAYIFVKALQYSPKKVISQGDIDAILDTDFGTDGDFWTVTFEGLQNAKDRIVTAYPALDSVQDQL